MIGHYTIRAEALRQGHSFSIFDRVLFITRPHWGSSWASILLSLMSSTMVVSGLTVSGACCAI